MRNGIIIEKYFSKNDGMKKMYLIGKAEHNESFCLLSSSSNLIPFLNGEEVWIDFLHKKIRLQLQDDLVVCLETVYEKDNQEFTSSKDISSKEKVSKEHSSKEFSQKNNSAEERSQEISSKRSS